MALLAYCEYLNPSPMVNDGADAFFPSQYLNPLQSVLLSVLKMV